MATYRISGDPRNTSILESLLNFFRHLDGLGISKTGLSVKLVSGGSVDVATNAELPNGQAAHIGVEEI